jgi:hypothetical protein
VKTPIPVRKISIATAKIGKSCGQKTCPRITNFRSTTFIISSGLPWIRMNGPTKSRMSRKALTHDRARVNRPWGLRG